jgi:hypothetical protein
MLALLLSKAERRDEWIRVTFPPPEKAGIRLTARLSRLAYLVPAANQTPSG